MLFDKVLSYRRDALQGALQFGTKLED